MEAGGNKANGAGLFKAASWIAVIILLSKIAGFLRDVVVANYYGTSVVSDAYYYAYQIPALVLVILGGVGGPFHSATVAVFSKLVSDFSTKPENSIKKLFNTFETFSVILFSALALICFFFPEAVMRLIINGENAELLGYASELLKIMSPIILIGAVIGLYYGILVTYKRFLLPNISPSMLSFGIIIVLLVTKGDNTGFYLALGTLAGALMQFFLQVPSIRKIGYGFSFSFDFFKNKKFNEILELLFPAFLSSTIGQLGIYVDMFFSSALKEGAWTAFSYANRIFQFPAGMLLTAILVPLFPLFSRLVADKDIEGIRYYYKKGLGSLIYAGTFLMICIFVVRTDAIRLALQRGAFDSNATLLVSDLLFFVTLSIIPYVVRDSATRLFYSFGDSKNPFLIAIGCIFLKLILNFLLVTPMGIRGIALSTTLVTLFNATMLTFMLRKKISLGYKNLIVNCAKIFVIALVSGSLGFMASKVYSDIFEWNFITGVIKLSFVIFTMSLVYLGLSHIFKVDYIEDIIYKIKNKFKKENVR